MTAYSFWKGYYEIKVFGFFIERFLNLVSYNNITIWDVKKIDDATMTFRTDRNGYKSLSPIASKTGCKWKVIRKVGVPFYIMRHKKRPLFPLLFICMVIGIYIYHLYIWQIEIIGEFTFPIEEMREELAKENIKVGVRKDSLNVEYIKNNMYMKRHDIAWIGIHFKGTKCTVEIIEAVIKKEEDDIEKVPCNIVADKSGMIMSINTLEGSPLVKSGDVVKEGDILISGVITSDWAPNRYVNAKGEIVIKTWYTNKKVISLEKDIVSYTGRKHNIYSLGIENYQINLGNSGTKFEKYDTIMQSGELNILGRWKIPIAFSQITEREIDVDTVKYTKKQAIEMAKNEVENAINNKIKSDVQVIKKDIKAVQGEMGITVIVTYECLEKVGVKKKLEG